MSLNFQPPKSLSPNPFDQAVYRLLGQLTRLPVVGLGQIQRLSEEVPALDPLDFLWWNAPTDASNLGYWRNRQGRFSLAALGFSHEISANHQDELAGIFEPGLLESCVWGSFRQSCLRRASATRPALGCGAYAAEMMGVRP